MAPSRSYVGLSSSFHDPAIAIVGPEGDVRFAEGIERYAHDKRAFHSTPDHVLRTPELIRRYGEPGTEVVAAISWSEVALRMSQVGETNELLPLRRLGRAFFAAANERTFHEASCWPYPDWTTMRRLLGGMLFTTGVSLGRSDGAAPPAEIRRYDHHLTHAAYACYSSPFADAACAIVDGYGEFASTSFYSFRDGVVTPLHKKHSLTNVERGSLGFLYAFVTGMCGFDALKGEEWKVMGLAPYGRVDQELYRKLKSLLRVNGLGLAPGLRIADEKRLFHELRDKRRRPDQPPIDAADIARTGQEVFRDVMRELLAELRKRDASPNLVLGGGCALNSSCNGRLVGDTGFEALHVPSAPADDGNAVGAALLAWKEDHPGATPKRTPSPFLGTGISQETRDNLLRFNTSRSVRHLADRIVPETARLLAAGKIIGWMQGRAEFGPRSLGNRSILADPRSPEMKDRINGRVKFREEYRPFAPSILHEHGAEYFEHYQFSPYMDRTLVFHPHVRERVPAVVHEDGTGRLQSVTPELNGRFHALVCAFHEITGVPIVLNTSLNIMGQPIVHSVEDALGLFYTTGLDALVVDDILIEKESS